VPASYLDAQNRICSYIFFIGPLSGLRVSTVRKYVGVILGWWRLVSPSVAPAAGEKVCAHQLAISRWAETDRRLRRQFQHVDPAFLSSVFHDTDPPVTVRAACLFGYAYLCRTGEFVQSEHSDDWKRNLVCWEHIVFGEDAQGRTLTVHFHNRKNNTPSAGTVQTVIRRAIPGSDLCVVAAMYAMRDARRASGLADPAPRDPIFWHDSGRPLAASDIAETLRAGARAQGRSTDKLSTYSLRCNADEALRH
jgi:hypothetical protein